MGLGRAATVGLAVATGAGVIGGMGMAARVEATRHQGRSYEYTMLGNTFIPLPRVEVQQNIGALAGAGALLAAGSKLANVGNGAVRGAGLVMESVGLGFLAGDLLVLVMP